MCNSSPDIPEVKPIKTPKPAAPPPAPAEAPVAPAPAEPATKKKKAEAKGKLALKNAAGVPEAVGLNIFGQ